jgi:hypothetical protein
VPEADWIKARRRFWELYWGELAMVEGEQVANAMVAFGNALRDLAPQDSSARARLRGAALTVAHAARQAVESHWGFTLPAIKDLLAGAHT